MAVVAQELDFVDEREKELYATAHLGEEAKEFLRNHPVGRYLHNRAKLMILEAKQDALDVDPDGWSWFRARSKLRQIRQRAAIASAFIQWIGDAIVDGNQATRELDEYRS